MGNTNEKEVIAHIAKSPAVQRIVHQTAIQLARILSASVIEICKQMIDRPIASSRSNSNKTTIYGNVTVHIHTQNMDVFKYEQQMKQVIRKASRKLDEAVEDAEIVERHKAVMDKVRTFTQSTGQRASDQSTGHTAGRVAERQRRKWTVED